MQFFERSSVKPPAFLISKEVVEARRELIDFLLLGMEQRSQTSAPISGVVLDNDNVMRSLSKLFRGKCAFCERHQTVLRPYQFRPVADALPTKKAKDHHLYYTWLALAWENIYPICRDCLPHRPDYFPVDGEREALPTPEQLNEYVMGNLGCWGGYPLREKNLLLDPCFGHSFHEHLHINHKGVLKALSVQGSMTIQFFKLDHPDREKERAVCLGDYRSRLFSLGLAQLRDNEAGKLKLFNFPSLEFGGLWYLQCRQIAIFLSKGDLTEENLAPGEINETFRTISHMPNLELAIEKVRSRLIRTDFGFKLQLAALRSDWVAPKISPETGPAEYLSLQSFTLENFKSIEQLSIKIPQRRPPSYGAETVSARSPALLLLGENAAGKSSILEAIALTLVSDETRNILGVSCLGLTLNPSFMGGEPQLQARMATVTLNFHEGKSRVLKITRNAFEQLELEGTPPVFAYGAFRQYKDASGGEEVPEGSVFSLFDSSCVLFNPEVWLLSLEDNDFHEVMRVLRIIFSVDSQYELIRRDYNLKRCLIVTDSKDETRAGQTPLNLASSGYRSLLAMVCDILRGLMDMSINPYFQNFPTAQAVVLIDEVEAHLHPRWKIRVMSALREALPKVTFIATSHDPLCLRGMHKDEVAVVRRRINVDDDLSVKIECISDLPDVGKLTVEQLLTSDFFNLMSTDEPDMQLQLAELADLLARQEKGDHLNPAEKEALKKFKREILGVLPVGSTEAQRLVQKSVAKFLKKRNKAAGVQLKSLRKKYREEIVAILERF